jgi:hypothetical protein
MSVEDNHPKLRELIADIDDAAADKLMQGAVVLPVRFGPRVICMSGRSSSCLTEPRRTA